MPVGAAEPAPPPSPGVRAAAVLGAKRGQPGAQPVHPLPHVTGPAMVEPMHRAVEPAAVPVPRRTGVIGPRLPAADLDRHAVVLEVVQAEPTGGRPQVL